MQKEYYKLRAKVKLTSHLSYRSRCGLCGLDVVAGMEWMHFIFIFYSNYLHMSKKSSNFASKIVTRELKE